MSTNVSLGSSGLMSPAFYECLGFTFALIDSTGKLGCYGIHILKGCLRGEMINNDDDDTVQEYSVYLFLSRMTHLALPLWLS